MRSDHPLVPADADGRPAPPARALSLRRRRAQGRRRRQRGHARVDHAAARPRRRATRCSCSSRRRRLPCSSRSSARASSRNHGQRVVEGQRLTQAASDIMLGWHSHRRHRRGVKRDFYVRQLWDAKGSALVELMDADRRMAFYADALRRRRSRARTRAPATRSRSQATSARSDTFDRALAALRRDIRGPKRARLQDADQGRRERTDHSPDRNLGATSSGPAFRRRSEKQEQGWRLKGH